MSPGVREAALSTKAPAMMRKPRTLHCPYCDGKALPVRGLHEHERVAIRPRLELDEANPAVPDHRVNLVEHLAGGLELEDCLGVAEGERRLPQALSIVDGDLVRRAHLDPEAR